VLGRAEETGGRTARAFSLIERALTVAKMEREEIECLAVGLGPGSYAGIRSAISLAQGWQMALSVRLLGINSVECMAARAQGDKLFGPAHFIIDAQRGEFYCASYDIAADSLKIVEPLRLLALDEAKARCETGRAFIWPDLLPRFPYGHVLLPDAATLGMLASGRTDFVSGDKLEPVYLRETSFVKAPPPRVKAQRI
jgi:tRNA threonylcarbamoyl adenosine modification protein YeaZ